MAIMCNHTTTLWQWWLCKYLDGASISKLLNNIDAVMVIYSFNVTRYVLMLLQ